MLEILECCTTKEEMNSSPHVLLVEYEKSPSMRITIEAHMNHSQYLTSLSLYVSLEKISHRYKCQWKNEHHDHIVSIILNQKLIVHGNIKKKLNVKIKYLFILLCLFLFLFLRIIITLIVR